jgi:hypothetical protein
MLICALLLTCSAVGTKDKHLPAFTVSGKPNIIQEAEEIQNYAASGK